MIENRWLRYALALGEHRNFARAAEALKITQPSLSRSIASLESSLGVKLFDRTTKGATPTAYGKVLLERGAALLRGEAGLRREIQLLAGIEAGELVVGAGPYSAEGIVAIALGRLARMHPRLRIRSLTEQPPAVMRAVLDERVDVGAAAISAIDEDPRLAVEPLPPQRIYVACRSGHPLTQGAAPTLARVLEFPLATMMLLGGPAVLAASGGKAVPLEEARGAVYTPPILVGTIVAARTIARESDAVVPGPALALAEDVAHGRLVLLDLTLPLSVDKGAILTLQDRTLSPAAAKFIELLRDVSHEEVRKAESVMAEAIRAARRRARKRVTAPGDKATTSNARRAGKADDHRPATR
jgi:DNA-binding transcriptional LysR family regulator